jgi:hypothetical protein
MKLERYDLISKHDFDTNWCESCDHMVTSTHKKIDNKSCKIKTGLIEMWYNKKLSQGTSTIRIRTPTLWILIHEWEV